MRHYYEQLYINQFDNLNEWKNFQRHANYQTYTRINRKSKYAYYN